MNKYKAIKKFKDAGSQIDELNDLARKALTIQVDEKKIDEPIVINEDSLDRCFTCGKKFHPKDLYDFYCSKKCERADNKRIKKMIREDSHPVNIMNESLKKISVKK